MRKLAGLVSAVVLAVVVLAVVVPALSAAPASAQDLPELQPYVVGGDRAPEGEHPSVVAMLSSGQPDTFQAQFCGGTLVSPEWVLTAAHCFYGETPGAYLPAEAVDALVGQADLNGSGGRRVDALTLAVSPRHPGEDPEGGPPAVADLALVGLSEPVAVSTSPWARPGQPLGDTGTIVGWGDVVGEPDGRRYASRLQELDVPVRPDADCQGVWGPFYSGPEMVCAGLASGAPETPGPGACVGDSGGPLFVPGPDGAPVVAGVVSFGAQHCGEVPSVFTEASAFSDWVGSVTSGRPTPFIDMAGSVHATSVRNVFDADVAQGSGDRYRPRDGVTRAELATFLARAFGLTPEADDPNFPDIAGSVHAANIRAAADEGIVGGYADGTYRPDVTVDRAQMATFLAQALDLPPSDEGSFPDVDPDSVHAPNIRALAASGITGGYADGTYRPRLGVTRAQMATFLASGLGL